MKVSQFWGDLAYTCRDAVMTQDERSPFLENLPAWRPWLGRLRARGLISNDTNRARGYELAARTTSRQATTY